MVKDFIDRMLDQSADAESNVKFARKENYADRYEEIISRTNIVFKMLGYIEQSFQRCQLFCRTCAQPIENFGVKPTICTEDICRVRFEEIGVGFDLAAEIATDPDVFDLMVSFLYAAVHGGRIELHFPTTVSAQLTPTTTTSFYSGDSTTGCKNVALLQSVVALIPSVDDMLENSHRLRAYLDEVNVLIYPLLRWVVASNTSHLRTLPMSASSSCPGLTCRRVFVLLTESIDKEKEFRRLRAEARDEYSNSTLKPRRVSSDSSTGSFFAYHGSGAGNWHSILRMGLKNYSNTSYMSAGAAYGKGVYFAEDINVSLGYSRGGVPWPRSRLQVSTCIALCEIVDRPADFSHAGSGLSSNVYVVPQEGFIATRYLMVNPAITSSDTGVVNLKASVVSEHLSTEE
jgi:hypothetical protein